MISYEKALSLIVQNATTPKKQEAAVFEALGAVLAEDIRAPFALPRFDNSAVDGYAFRSTDTENASLERPAVLKIAGIVKAGDDGNKILVKPNEAYRILTGAAVPSGADTVMPQEHAELESTALIFRKPWPAPKNIRRRGEELQKGEKVLPKGLTVNPSTVGILASLGKKAVKIYEKPAVSVLATGTELAEPGARLRAGEIYDSNTWMLKAALMQMGIIPAHTLRLADRSQKITDTIAAMLEASDFLILTGGVSVGDTDFVKSALKALSVRTIFWKVSQKPGKPLYFGKKGRTLIFGLPGNPASVFTCFYEYVYPSIRRRMGYRRPGLDELRLPLENGVETSPGKSLFLKARVQNFARGKRIRPLGRQASHMLSSLADTTGILFVPPSRTPMAAGQIARVHPLPYKAHG